MKTPSEIIVILCLVGAIMFSAFVIVKSARSEDFKLLGWIRCSNIGIECIDYIFNSKFMCEAGKPPEFDCVAVNERD